MSVGPGVSPMRDARVHKETNTQSSDGVRDEREQRQTRRDTRFHGPGRASQLRTLWKARALSCRASVDGFSASRGHASSVSSPPSEIGLGHQRTNTSSCYRRSFFFSPDFSGSCLEREKMAFRCCQAARQKTTTQHTHKTER